MSSAEIAGQIGAPTHVLSGATAGGVTIRFDDAAHTRTLRFVSDQLRDMARLEPWRTIAQSVPADVRVKQSRDWTFTELKATAITLSSLLHAAEGAEPTEFQQRCREVLRVVNLGYIEIILYRREQEVGTCRNQSM